MSVATENEGEDRYGGYGNENADDAPQGPSLDGDLISDWAEASLAVARMVTT